MIPLLIGLVTLTTPVDLTVLRDTICEWETRGEKYPNDAVGADGELGQCQIKVDTARWAGYRGSNRGLLQPGGEVNRAVALAIITKCANQLETNDPHRIAYCYNGGRWKRLNPKSTAWGYANQVAIKYWWRIEYSKLC